MKTAPQNLSLGKHKPPAGARPSTAKSAAAKLGKGKSGPKAKPSTSPKLAPATAPVARPKAVAPPGRKIDHGSVLDRLLARRRGTTVV